MCCNVVFIRTYNSSCWIGNLVCWSQIIAPVLYNFWTSQVEMAIHKWGALCVRIFTCSGSLLSVAGWIWTSCWACLPHSSSVTSKQQNCMNNISKKAVVTGIVTEWQLSKHRTTYQERGAKQQLEVLCNLYALSNLHKTHSGDFLATGYLTGIQVFHAKDQHNALFSCVSNFNPSCISQICLCMLHAFCWWNVMLSNSERWLECNINSYTTSKGLLNWHLTHHRAHDTHGWRTARSLKLIAYCVDPDFAGTSKCCCICWCFWSHWWLLRFSPGLVWWGCVYPFVQRCKQMERTF